MKLTLCIADNEPVHLSEDEMRSIARAIKQAVVAKQDVQVYLRCESPATQKHVQLELPLEQ